MSVSTTEMIVELSRWVGNWMPSPAGFFSPETNCIFSFRVSATVPRFFRGLAEHAVRCAAMRASTSRPYDLRPICDCANPPRPRREAQSLQARESRRVGAEESDPRRREKNARTRKNKRNPRPMPATTKQEGTSADLGAASHAVRRQSGNRTASRSKTERSGKSVGQAMPRSFRQDRRLGLCSVWRAGTTAGNRRSRLRNVGFRHRPPANQRQFVGNIGFRFFRLGRLPEKSTASYSGRDQREQHAMGP